jgi:ATP-dependent protease ClpP protease subunit
VKQIDIRGVIVPNDDEFAYNEYGYENTTPAKIKEAIDAADGDDLTVTINSPGGDVASASEIYTMLAAYPGNVTGHIYGNAYSAACTVAMGCHTLLASPSSRLMIHNASTNAWGNHNDMEQTASMLSAADRSIAAVYAAKSGMSEQQVLDLMEQTTWMTAQDALDLHLVDGIMFTDGNKKNLEFSAACANAYNAGLLPDRVINKMRADRAKETAAALDWARVEYDYLKLKTEVTK